MIRRAATSETMGLMLSGGVDSAILLGDLVASGQRVQPFYVTTGCQWETVERQAIDRLLRALDSSRIEPVVDLAMPADEFYADHWSTTGRLVPDSESLDEAVFLPARNPLLLLKPLLWCGQHGLSNLALATLSNNPFDDARPEFFELFQAAIASATGAPVKIVRPFAESDKAEILTLGTELPLHLTFSCLSPHNGLHCGDCNKCAERARALQSLPNSDPTVYASGIAAT